MPTGAIQVLDTINDDREITYRRGTAADFRREVANRRSYPLKVRTGQPRYVVQYLVDNEIVADNQGRHGAIRVLDEKAMRAGRSTNPEKRGKKRKIHKMRWKPDAYTVRQIVHDLRSAEPELSHTYNIARDLPVYEWGEGHDLDDPDLDLSTGLYPVPHDIMWERLAEGDERNRYATWISNHVDMDEVKALLRGYGYVEAPPYEGAMASWSLPDSPRGGGRVFVTEDGYTFYEQTDGTLTDAREPKDADMVYESIAALREEVGAALRRDRLGVGSNPEENPDPDAPYPQLTPKEKAVIRSILNNEHGEDATDEVWTAELRPSKISKRSMGGILASLAKKELVALDGVTGGRPTEGGRSAAVAETVGLTPLGVETARFHKVWGHKLPREKNPAGARGLEVK